MRARATLAAETTTAHVSNQEVGATDPDPPLHSADGQHNTVLPTPAGLHAAGTPQTLPSGKDDVASNAATQATPVQAAEDAAVETIDSNLSAPSSTADATGAAAQSCPTNNAAQHQREEAGERTRGAYSLRAQPCSEVREGEERGGGYSLRARTTTATTPASLAQTTTAPSSAGEAEEKGSSNPFGTLHEPRPRSVTAFQAAQTQPHHPPTGGVLSRPGKRSNNADHDHNPAEDGDDGKGRDRTSPPSPRATRTRRGERPQTAPTAPVCASLSPTRISSARASNSHSGNPGTQRAPTTTTTATTDRPTKVGEEGHEHRLVVTRSTRTPHKHTSSSEGITAHRDLPQSLTTSSDPQSMVGGTNSPHHTQPQSQEGGGVGGGEGGGQERVLRRSTRARALRGAAARGGGVPPQGGEGAQSELSASDGMPEGTGRLGTDLATLFCYLCVCVCA